MPLAHFDSPPFHALLPARSSLRSPQCPPLPQATTRRGAGRGGGATVAAARRRGRAHAELVQAATMAQAWA